MRELIGALLIVGVFLAVTFGVNTRTPTVWADEPEYVDPAANLYFGSGFTSTLWAQDRHEFWCGNVPLYQGLLYCSFKLFGFGLFQARLVNTVLAGAGGFLIWAALRQSGLVRRPASRLICLALILSGSVSTLTFRTIRPDATMFFICSLVFYAATLPAHRRSRRVWVILFSALLPIAGVPMLPYAGLMMVIYASVYGLANLALPAGIAGGLVPGLGALAAFYRHFSNLHTVFGIVVPFTALGGAGHAGPPFLKTRIFGAGPGMDNLFTSFFGNPTQFINHMVLFDYSAAILFLLVIMFAFQRWRSADDEQRKLIWFIVAVTLIVPPFMHFAGHYRSMYRWMTFIPLAIAVPRLLEMESVPARPFARRIALAAIGFSVFLGVPLRSLAIIPGWSGRSMKPFEQVAAQVVRPSDVVVCTGTLYFGIRPRAGLLYTYGLPARAELSRAADLPKNDVTLLCVIPRDFKPVTQIVGGNWRKVSLEDIPEAAAFAGSRYAADFYRRDSN